jgi:hypothetical protein
MTGMKTKVLSWTAIIMLLLTVAGCKNSTKISLPPCTGRPGEVVLVISDDLYKGAVGDSLVKILTIDEPALPQTGMEGAESMFDLVRIPTNAFNNMIRPARNLIIVEVDPIHTKPEIRAFKDYWSAEQILIRLNAPDAGQLMTLIDENRNSLVETLRDGEVNRQLAYNRKYQNVELARQLLANHQIISSFPKEFESRLDTGNFAWIHYDPAEMTQGVLIWTYPYTNQSQVEYAELLSFTDKHLKPRVPGPSRGSYMSIDLDFPVSSRTLEVNGNFVTELKGLWETDGDFMGGPFISWSFIDEKRSRIVTVFGYVYAPKIAKRNPVRKVESLLKTIDFPD